MTTLLSLLACYGIAFFLQNKAPQPPGPAILLRLLGCTFCVGFHVGWIVWLLQNIPGHQTAPHTAALNCLTFAFASAAFCYTLDATTQWLENSRK